MFQLGLTSSFASSIASITLVSVALVACSGSTPSGVSGSSASTSPQTYPCCHGGFIYKCASEAALATCSDSSADDTTDCTKTATACGEGAGAAGGGSGASGGGSGATGDGGTGGTAATKATGTKCADEKECTGGLCLTFNQGSVGFCSNTCATKNDCPSDFTCRLIESGVKACAPAGEQKLGETCSYNMDCVSELCLTVGSATTGYCTAPCTAAVECPAGWTCDAVGGASGKYCHRP